MARKRPIIVNTAMTPTYWGSLAAVVVGMGALVLSAIRSGPPAHVVPPATPLFVPIFYLTIVIVLLFTLRYYSALSVNIYGGSASSVYKLSPTPRIVMFCLLSVLVCICVSAAGAIASVGILTALYLCLSSAAISFLCWAVFWLLSYEARRKYIRPHLAFGFGDIIVFVLMLIATQSLAETVTGSTVTTFAIIVGVMAVVMIHEFARVFLPEFRNQMVDLSQKLQSP